MDMDSFKKINDNYGHASGDQALITLTRICARGTRKMDVFARLGGEEFALLTEMTARLRDQIIKETASEEVKKELFKKILHHDMITWLRTKQ